MKTIRMKKADWEKWDAALRSGKYGQADSVLSDGYGNYCCLGVLQFCLDSGTEDNNDELPSHSWLAAHGIQFDSAGETKFADAEERVPLLPTLNMLASDANDMLGKYGTHRFDFIAIANAIKDAVEFTDA